MSEPVFATSEEARQAGWFSRRHKTAEAARAARQTHQATKSPDVRRQRGRQMNADRQAAALRARVAKRSSWRDRLG